MKKNQTLIGIILVAVMVSFGFYLNGRGVNLPMSLITGLRLGYILARSRYGFAGGIKRIYLTGEGSLTRALLLMFAISIIGVAGVHFGAAQKGAVVAYKALEGAVIISLLILLALYGFTQYYENKRRNQGTLIETVYEGTENSIPQEKEYKFFSKETYHKLFVERWSFAKGGVLIAVMFLFIMNTTGSSWGASGPYTLWGIWVLQKIGVTFSSPAFEGAVKSVNSGLMNNAVSIRNIGIIGGAAIAFLLAGRFKFDFNFKIKDTVYYALGGLLMGYGAKVGGGCNVGALYSAIANFSLSGWLFMVSLIIGGIIALKLFQQKHLLLDDINFLNLSSWVVNVQLSL